VSIVSNSQFLPRQYFLAHSQRLPGTVLLGRPFAQRALCCVLCGVQHAASAGSLSVRFDAPCVPHGESSDGSAAPFGAKHVAYDALPVLPLYLRAPYYPPCLTYNPPILGCSRSASKTTKQFAAPASQHTVAGSYQVEPLAKLPVWSTELLWPDFIEPPGVTTMSHSITQFRMIDNRQSKMRSIGTLAPPTISSISRGQIPGLQLSLFLRAARTDFKRLTRGYL
jgi:hypothetical protein